MHVIDRISAQETNFSEQYKLYSNTFNLSINECISEVNKHSLKQLLLAFLREDILPYHYQNATVIFDLQRSNYFMYVTRVKLFSLLRFTHFDSLILKHKATSLKQTITDPLKLLDIVKNELESILNMDQWLKFYKEIANHLQNALLSTWKKYSVNKLIDRSKKNSHHQLNNLLKSPQITVNGSLQFEQSVFSGHPYHPCAKTKLGFTIEDTINYSPEFQSKVGIYIAAVKKQYVHIESMQQNINFTEWFSECYPVAWANWIEELKKNNLEVKNYIPFPVHPWQVYYFTFILPLFKDYIENKIIVFFDKAKIIASPTLSFRTLLPIENSNSPYIKLPVAVQATSIVRTLSPISTKNMPRISNILKKILITENYFSSRLGLLPESYGLHLKELNVDEAKHFTAIFRENITQHLNDNEVAIVVAAFFEKSSLSETNLFIEIMQLSGCLTYQDALGYFLHYTDLVLGSYLDLFLLYGIALEGHQQNTLAILRDGKIKRFIARDFDGIEMHDESLQSMGINLDLTENSPYLQKNKETVRNQLLYTVYQLHLGEIVLLLANYFNCEEKPFWKIVREVTEQRFYALKNRMCPITWKKEFNTILNSHWPIKALLRMRLEKNYLRDGLFSQIVNPLSV
ncbi:IucA/IucC family protein [Rickettsiella endosymbiont of Miltochrista miniata]|uniref:IucA/IucC family protein n=1 Tax=Rickettsiella endosymbiont of Miltochrista miniata TaxID=3066239 RepID=UPI00313CC31C